MRSTNNRIGQTPYDPGKLSELLAEAEQIEQKASRIRSIPLSGVPGRELWSARLAAPGYQDEMLSLTQRRDDTLRRMAGEALPTGCWVTHGNRLIYLQATTIYSKDAPVYELYRIPASDSRWIPESTPEHPTVTTRRIEYARWYRTVSRVMSLGTVIVAAPVLAAIAVWSWPASLILLGASFLIWLGLGWFITHRLGAGTRFKDGRPHEPFDKIAPGTGGASEPLQREQKARRDKEKAKLLKKIAPIPQNDTAKTHDYDYRYEGLHPGASAEARVRIYQAVGSHLEGRQAPVIILSQKLPPGGTSITNLIEAVAAEVVLSELPHLLPRGKLQEISARRHPPFHVVEHYSEGHDIGRRNSGDAEGEATAIVTFSDYRIQGPMEIPEVQHTNLAGQQLTIITGNRTERPRFGEPEWHHEGRYTVEQMIGQKL